MYDKRSRTKDFLQILNDVNVKYKYSAKNKRDVNIVKN